MRGKSGVQGGIGFGFAPHWLKNWRESFKPIAKRSNRNHAITFDSQLKTALSQTCSKRGKKSRVHDAIAFGFASHKLKNCASLLSQSLSVAIAIM